MKEEKIFVKCLKFQLNSADCSKGKLFWVQGFKFHLISWTTLKFGCLFTGSEWTQQVIVRKIWDDNKRDFRRDEASRLALDWGSIGRYAIWGFVVFPHVLKGWYAVLDGKFPGNAWRAVTAKTAVDQICFPLPILASFYVFLSALEGKTDSWKGLVQECQVKLWATLKARYCFMLPAQLLNFALVPPHHRVIYVGCTTYVWLNVLCIYKRLDLDSEVFAT